MEKLFAALIPVLCVMTLGPLFCELAGKVGLSKASRAPGACRRPTNQESSL